MCTKTSTESRFEPFVGQVIKDICIKDQEEKGDDWEFKGSTCKASCCGDPEQMKPDFLVIILMHLALALPPLAFGIVFAFGALKTVLKKFAKGLTKVVPGMASTAGESSTAGSSGGSSGS